MMDGRGGCCIARYAGGAYEVSKVDRIMLRFRPIAPKPAATGGGSVSGGSTTPESNNSNVKSWRGKRRYVRDNNNSNSSSSSNKRCNRKKKVVPEETSVVTLPLLPETPDRKDTPGRGSSSPVTEKKKQVQMNSPIWLNFNKNNNHQYNTVSYGGGLCGSDRTVVVMPQPVRFVGSWVTVECVTDTWVDEGLLGCTDEERRKNLEWDTCPGFISDGLNRVMWTNGAYRKMVGRQGEDQEEEEEEEEEGEMMVWLEMKERVPMSYAAFTCRVRLVYTCGKEKSSLILPCDVWRMEGGGCAWRLDVKAALSLGR